MSFKTPALHTKTFTNFTYLLNSKKMIRLQEKPLSQTKHKKKDSKVQILLNSENSTPLKRFSSQEPCFSEDSSPRHMVQTFKNKLFKSQEPQKKENIYQRISRIRNSSPKNLYGLEFKQKTIHKEKARSLIPIQDLTINLSGVSSIREETKRKPKQKHFNIDSIKEFQKEEKFSDDSMDNSPNNMNSNRADKNAEAKYAASEESEEEKSAFLDSSWREIKKNDYNKTVSKLLPEQEVQEKQTHSKILEVLKKINHSDLMLFDGIINKNVRSIKEVKKNEMINPIDNSAKTVNEIISPNKRLLKDPVAYNLIESNANRFNVKNKRITLHGFITKTEWENEKNASLPAIREKNAGSQHFKIKNNNIKKREFYSKWYLPVHYWKVEKPEQKKDLMDTPLKYGKKNEFFNYESFFIYR